MRKVYESIGMLIGDVKEECTTIANTPVEALIAIEGPDLPNSPQARRTHEMLSSCCVPVLFSTGRSKSNLTFCNFDEKQHTVKFTGRSRSRSTQ